MSYADAAKKGPKQSPEEVQTLSLLKRLRSLTSMTGVCSFASSISCVALLWLQTRCQLTDPFPVAELLLSHLLIMMNQLLR